MAETLGMLCDKLTIINLKAYHSTDKAKLDSLEQQANQLKGEIDEYLHDAISGKIIPERLTFDANKVYKQDGNLVTDVYGSIGSVFYTLADVNCKLWHEQEKVYDFEAVPIEQKDSVVKNLALLNLERNKCIDAINQSLKQMIQSRTQ